MLDIELIDSTIHELEEEETNFANCQKLASLYTVKKFYEEEHPTQQKVEVELNDILPQYRKYCEVKRHYQLKEATDQQVLDSLKEVCKEIREFFHTLYSSTDMQEEREQLDMLIKSL